MPVRLSLKNITVAVKTALDEDVGSGDITTRCIARPADRAAGVIRAQAPGVIAGVLAVKEVFRQLDVRVKVRAMKTDGMPVRRGEVLIRITGPAAPIIIGERTALNFLGMLSGIATITAQYVKALRGTKTCKTRIFDTRKTPPGLRGLVKHAVAAGGGCNHRMGLYDAVLIKDNHIALAGSLAEAIRRVRKGLGSRKRCIEVEAEDMDQVGTALESGADIILLDNFPPARIREAVKLIQGQAVVEVSGGLELKAIKAAALRGVDRVSIGALTHSTPWLAMHMELE